MSVVPIKTRIVLMNIVLGVTYSIHRLIVFTVCIYDTQCSKRRATPDESVAQCVVSTILLLSNVWMHTCALHAYCQYARNRVVLVIYSELLSTCSALEK